MSPRRRRLLSACAAALAIVVGAAVVWRLYRSTAGEPSARLDDGWNESRRVLDRNGQLLRDLPSAVGLRGESLPLERIGARLVIATLVSEDQRFFEHDGFDARALVRALGQNARHVRVVSGASTITQQLVKLLDAGGEPPTDRGIGDKLRETARAENLEARLSKRQILEAYLNRLAYGNALVGPAAAAHAYFGVRPADLSWAQAALLAVLPRAPSYLDPLQHLDRAEKRQRALLDALEAAGAIDATEHARAAAEPIEPRPVAHAFVAPHFVEALRQDGELAARGPTRTTLDVELQGSVEALARAHRARLRGRGASNLGALVVDNDSGEVLAYLGNADFADADAGGQTDMVRALRQPGSALKPFAYALAFAAGLSPAAPLADVPTRFTALGGGWAPDNFDGAFRGPVSAREALAGSLNLPAVRLAERLPRGALLARLREIGLRSLDRDADHYGLSLVLGSGEVSLFGLVGAYAALARGGETVALRRTMADASALGTSQRGERRLAADAAAAVSDALSDPLARLRGLGGRGPFDLGFPVAVKTGTSSGHRDGWTIGYTRALTVGVWVGNADGRPTSALTGAEGAGPLFADIMRAAMATRPERRPLVPPGLLEAVSVCPLSGEPVSDACPEAVLRRLPAAQAARLRGGDRHGRGCSLHRRATRSATGWRCDERGSEVLVALPDEYASWLASQPPGAPGQDQHGHPWLLRAAVPGCGEQAAALGFDEPAAGAVVLLPATDDRDADHSVHVAVSWRGAPGGLAGGRVQIVLDGAPVATLAPPYQAEVPVRRGDHVLGARPLDPLALVALAETRFSVR